MPPPYCTAKMRSPVAVDALEIHVALALLPAVHVAPPSCETRIGPPASPATITVPSAFVDIECQMRGVENESVHVYAGVVAVVATAAVCGSMATAAGKAGASGMEPPPPQALNQRAASVAEMRNGGRDRVGMSLFSLRRNCSGTRIFTGVAAQLRQRAPQLADIPRRTKPDGKPPSGLGDDDPQHAGVDAVFERRHHHHHFAVGRDAQEALARVHGHARGRQVVEIARLFEPPEERAKCKAEQPEASRALRDVQAE